MLSHIIRAWKPGRRCIFIAWRHLLTHAHIVLQPPPWLPLGTGLLPPSVVLVSTGPQTQQTILHIFKSPLWASRLQTPPPKGEKEMTKASFVSVEHPIYQGRRARRLE